jgi:glycosyltransferase involved in cell wall biosynthesis
MTPIIPVKNIVPYRIADCSLSHVLLIVDQFPETLGGGERIALKLAELLPQFGYRASILTFSIHPKNTALEHSKSPIYLLPLKRTYDLQALRAAIGLKRFLVSQNIQIVQTFFESSDLWGGLVTKMMSKAKLIWSRRDMGILRANKHNIAYRLMATAPDAVFAVSEQVRQYCINVDHIDADRVLTIYNGLEMSSRASIHDRPRSTDRLIVTTVGNIRRVKGHDVFIKSAALLIGRFPNVQFSVVGAVLEADYFKELQNIISDLNLADHFHFVGELVNSNTYMENADIFVLPSHSEGFSNAIIEAMAASLPVVATNVGGNAEAVIDGVSGFIVPKDDPIELSVAISKLLSNPALRKTMGEAGHAIVTEKFTVEAMMKKITHSYERLLLRA